MTLKALVEGYSVLIRGISLKLVVGGGSAKEKVLKGLMKKEVIMRTGGRVFRGHVFSVNFGDKTRMLIKINRNNRFFVNYFFDLVGNEIYMTLDVIRRGKGAKVYTGKNSGKEKRGGGSRGFSGRAGGDVDWRKEGGEKGGRKEGGEEGEKATG